MHAVVWAFFRRGLQEALSYRIAFALRLGAVALSLASFYYFARFIDMGRSPLLEPYGGDYVSFGLVGMIMLDLQHTVVSSYPASIRQAQLTGTLEAMLATPTPAWLVLLSAPAYRFVTAFVWGAVYMVVAGLFFGVHFDRINLPSLGLALPLTVIAFASLGFVGAAVTMLLRRTDPISYALGGLSALAGGVFYPTAVLPGWLEDAGRLLPVTHALELVRRATFAGATITDMAPQLTRLAIFCAVGVPLGLLAFGWTLRRARKDGSLTHF